MNNEKIDKLLETIAKEPLPDDIAAIAEQESKEFSRTISTQQPNIWRIIMKSRITKLAAAAVILIAVIISTNYFGGSVTSVAWADVIENIYKTKSVNYKITSRIEGRPERINIITYVAPNLLLDDNLTYEKTTIWNYKNGCYRLSLHHDTKTAVLINSINGDYDPNGMPVEIESLIKRHLWDYFCKDYEKEREYLESEIIDGIKADVFVVKNRFAKKVKVWINKQTQLPIRAEINSRVLTLKDGEPYQPSVEYILSDFVWNQAIDESAFSVEVPIGYAVKKYDVDVSGPSEKTLIEALRACSEFCGGIFPEKFEDKPLAKIVIDNTKDDLPRDEKVKIYRKVKIIEAGFNYCKTLQDDNDWHYFGNVKYGDSNAILCYWKPDGMETYRVVYGDLSVEDIYPEDLFGKS